LQDLLEQLPVRDRSVDGLNAVLRSPQLAQAVAPLVQVSAANLKKKNVPSLLKKKNVPSLLANPLC
jgi:hypothetical protein